MALTSNFRKLPTDTLLKTYSRSGKRVFLLDHDGTLVPQGESSSRPGDAVLRVLQGLTANPANTVYVISGRARTELESFFSGVVSLRFGWGWGTGGWMYICVCV